MRTPPYIFLLLALVALAGCAAPRDASQSEGLVTVRYDVSDQVEIVSPGGTRVLLDVDDPSQLSSPATAGDVLLTSHRENDHRFISSFPGRKLTMSLGQLDVGDVKIQGIASSFTGPLSPDPAKADNYIYVIDTGGLRIAHFGNIGQGELTREQLAALGQVDIVFSQFANKDSGISAYNKKGFNVIDQVEPKVVIPYHYNRLAAEYAVQHWIGSYAEGSELTFRRSELPAKTTIVFMGEGATSLGKLLNVPAYEVDAEP